MIMKQAILAIGMAVACSGLQACSKQAVGNGTGGRGASPSVPEEPPLMGFRYPAARWRLATFEQLDRATLWVAHIAIRHDHSQVDLFRPPGWRPDSPSPARSVAQALALAEKIRAQLASVPARFEELARTYSEDVVSRDDGGMMGGVRVSQFINNDFLDALATLKPGEVSHPFQTPYGFHILKRYPPPPEEAVTGQRIVIGYPGVVGLVAESHRTRAEALRLATEVAERAEKDPGSFTSLVDRYSENVDRAHHGDMGAYSTRDPGYSPVEIFRLTNTKVGEVTGPVDSRFGFEILKRVSPRRRTEYAMATIELTSNAPDRDAAMVEAQTLADGVLRELRVVPARFQEFQRQYCCDQVQRWAEGRGDAELSQALERLAVGEIADKAIRRGGGYIVMKRLDPSGLAPAAPRTFELPNPTDPDYDALAGSSDGPGLARTARRFANALGEGSGFPAQSVTAIAKALEQFAAYVEQNRVDPDTARSTIRSTMGSLENELGGEQFGRLKAFGRRWIISQMMPPGSVD